MENKNVKVEVTAQAVKKAYDEIDMTPKPKTWYSKEDNCCCGLSALAMCQLSKDEYKDVFENQSISMHFFMQETLGLTINEVWGFVFGFDGKTMSKNDYNEKAFNEMQEMYKIGRETSNLLLGTNYTLN